MVCSRAYILCFSVLTCVCLLAGSAAAAECEYGVIEGLWNEQGGNPEAARVCYESAVSGNPQDAEALYALAGFLARQGEWGEAEKALDKLVKLRPDDPGPRLLLAEVYMAQEKYTWAVRALQPLSGKLSGLNQDRWNYLMGRVSLEMEDAGAAVSYFEAIPEERRYNFPELYFHLARAGWMAGDESAARSALEKYFKQSARNAEFDQAARTLLENTYVKEDATPRLNLSLALAFQYDSNVVQEPDDLDITRGESPGAFGTAFSAFAGYYPLRSGRHLAGVELSAFRNQYFKDPADDFDYTGLSATPRYRLRCRLLGYEQQLETGYSGNLGLLDGGSLAEEEQMYVYSESHSGWARWELKEESFGDTNIKLQYGRNLYHHQGRDNWGFKLSAGQSFFFMDKKLKFFVEGQARQEDAERADYDRAGLGVFAGVSALLPRDISTAAWVRYEALEHIHSQDSRVWGGEREDELTRLGFSISRPFGKNYTLGLAYNATINQSTIKMFNYERHVISLQVARRREW